jgi:hypothetical protein
VFGAQGDAEGSRERGLTCHKHALGHWLDPPNCLPGRPKPTKGLLTRQLWLANVSGGAYQPVSGAKMDVRCDRCQPSGRGSTPKKKKASKAETDQQLTAALRWVKDQSSAVGRALIQRFMNY